MTVFFLQETWKKEVALSFGKPQQELNCAANEKQQLKIEPIKDSFQETLIITRHSKEATISGGPGQLNGTRRVLTCRMCNQRKLKNLCIIEHQPEVIIEGSSKCQLPFIWILPVERP